MSKHYASRRYAGGLGPYKDSYDSSARPMGVASQNSTRSEVFNDWGGRGHDNFIPEEVTKTAPSGDRTT